eukprot:CAMPEP_0169295966 /NCGR_PEP_ID=MMETSP1016-20121227/64853_1 /TAXON_ID=342587 /ORGANISM="Karlodinium micrum, Strain CCMP2283" /LENGTH=102 /DNA_ID=CAMNT_0009387255 /DNA_START=184 /DNA_END=492 /DNA_ORIENTATION=+
MNAPINPSITPLKEALNPPVPLLAPGKNADMPVYEELNDSSSKNASRYRAQASATIRRSSAQLAGKASLVSKASRNFPKSMCDPECPGESTADLKDVAFCRA